jgi:phosphate starvation-inducible PhoH-like protein
LSPVVTEAFIPLSDDAARAVAGPHGRHAALIEGAFHVQLETPGGGVRLKGDAARRDLALRAVEILAGRIALGADVDESDVRAAIAAARAPARGVNPAAGAIAMGRRGAIAAKTRAQADYLEALRTHPLTFGVGPAGTGKTFLAVAYGASLMKAGEVSRLIVTRPAVEAGERLGFLPGDLTEKVDPYMAPIWDALRDLMGEAEVERLREPNPQGGQGGARRDRRAVEVAPIAFMRGRTLNHAFVIVDEAQNCTRAQMKMVLTRLGEGARMAVTGDPSQVDLPNRADSGLAHAVSLLEGVEGVSVSRFQASDVVRHPLVERIVKAYDADAAGLA